MPNRDLTAPSSQAKSELSTEARLLGEDIYRQIVDHGNQETLRKLQLLAEASERMESAVEIPLTRTGFLRRRVAAVMTFVTR